MEHVKASPPANPDQPVLVPGDPERAMRIERGGAGIEVDDETWKQIQERGAMFGLSAEEMNRIGEIA